MKDLFNLHNQFKNKEIIFIFSGRLTHSILTGIAEMIESNLEDLDVKDKKIQNIFAIMVEQLQNVINYSIPGDNYNYEMATCVIGKYKGSSDFFISSGNIIKSIDKEKLITKINFVNSLTKEELRLHYKEQRRTGSQSHPKGAGLGILEMARKVNSPLECTMKDIDESHTYYTIRASV